MTGSQRTFGVSGDQIILGGGNDIETARLVHAVARLDDIDLGPHALVGGLAVMCRLAAVHRATQDVDTVIEISSPTAVEVIAARIGSVDGSHPNRVVIDDVKIDIIETGSFQHADLDGIDDDDRLFIVSHRWALDTATESRIMIGAEAASIRLATPGALVAMKAGALLGGRPREPRKRGSDLYDLYRLLLEHDRTGAVAESLAAAPFGLGRLVASALRARVVAEPERASRWLRDSGPEIEVGVDDLLDVVGPLVERLAAEDGGGGATRTT